MPVTTYTTLDGMILSEVRGGVERDYMPDTLGSTIALLDSSQNKTDTWTYWPYGEVRTRTGSNPTPFTFVGTLGYFADSLKRLYVRARYLRTDLARWQTVDPLWPDESAYGYVGGLPTRNVDPSGLFVIITACPPPIHRECLRRGCKTCIRKIINTGPIRGYCDTCLVCPRSDREFPTKPRPLPEHRPPPRLPSCKAACAAICSTLILVKICAGRSLPEGSDEGLPDYQACLDGCVVNLLMRGLCLMP
jgi:RHS repeat-associated protein